MTTPTPDVTIDVNLRNPGQFFACCGLVELATHLWPGAEGWFGRAENRVSFNVATYSGHNDPLGEMTRKLYEPEELVVLAEDHETQPKADRKPVKIVPFNLRLDWWLDPFRGGDKSELKVWAGQQTPERNFNNLRDAWRKIRRHEPHVSTSRRLLQERWPVTGRFGFDPAASWEALDVGFSPDEQGMPVSTSPATEILAAIGLQRCRPMLVGEKRRWFAYYVWRFPLEISVIPAAMIGAGLAGEAYEFPVVMRNAQYGNFGWAKRWENDR